MTLAQFDPWQAISKTEQHAYCAYVAYPEMRVGTLGTLGTLRADDCLHLGSRVRRQRWLSQLAASRPMTALDRRLVWVARALALSPWSYRLIELGWSDTEIFSVQRDRADTLLFLLSANGAKLRVITDKAAWIDLNNGRKHLHQRDFNNLSGHLVWDPFETMETSSGN